MIMYFGSLKLPTANPTKSNLASETEELYIIQKADISGT